VLSGNLSAVDQILGGFKALYNGDLIIEVESSSIELRLWKPERELRDAWGGRWAEDAHTRMLTEQADQS